MKRITGELVKAPTFDTTRCFGLIIDMAKGHLPEANRELYRLYVRVLRDGYKLTELRGNRLKIVKRSHYNFVFLGAE